MVSEIERTIIDLVATDRVYKPSSSFDGKLERRRPKIAKQIVGYDGFETEFFGDRAYARLEQEDTMKARGLRQGVDEFAKQYPRYGKILNGLIEEERLHNERHLYFGMHDGKRITHDDYLRVLTGMGLSEEKAEQYYEVAIDISRTLMKKASEDERSVLIGKE